MTAILDTQLNGLDRDLERVLYAGVRQPLQATAVMNRAGFRFSIREGFHSKYVHPHSAWMEFVFSLRRVEHFFALHGFVLRKSGGTPFDDVWIEPHGASPSI